MGVLRSLLVAGALLGVAAGCSKDASGSSVGTTTSTTAVPVETTTTLEPSKAEGKEFFVYGPVEGDCIDLRTNADGDAVTTQPTPGTDATPQGSAQIILRLDCSLPHQYEVISVVEAGLPGDPRPGVEQLTTAAKRLCPPAFETYLGIPYQNSALEVGWVFPSEDQRNSGNQQIGCLAFDPLGKLVGSVRGTAR